MHQSDDTPKPADWIEDIASLLPALTLCQHLGYQYLTPDEALAARHGKKHKIILDTILEQQLRKLNHISYKGQRHAFSDKNIKAAVNTISDYPYDALATTGQALLELITLGKSFEQTIDGDRKSYSIHYIDWQHPENNVYHVSDEFTVERRGSLKTRRPDMVLFVNGIPLVVVEAKRPGLKDGVKQAISQHLRNHTPDEIPHLFVQAQLLLAISQNAASYGTTHTGYKFWAVWQEENSAQQDEELKTLTNRPLTDAQKKHLLGWREDWQLPVMERIWQSGYRMVSAQDRTLHSMVRPARLLDLVYRFIVYDAGIKKIARYQQYFAVNATLQRVTQTQGDAPRKGGVIWHTTGSGKSLTMVMLAKALVLEPTIPNPTIILVNDRVDLDKQLYATFKACGKQATRAQNGHHLLSLVNDSKAEIITTVIDKFETVAKEKTKNHSRDIFVLVDESHRSQYGQTHAKMRTVFPNACYLGFTGTPLLKKQKSTAHKFGGYIHAYSMRKAVEDKAVVPLIYEGRDSEFKNTEAVDKWFERITRDLNVQQKADLKRKFQSTEPLFEASERMAEIAWDIGKHYADNFKPSGAKAQFATGSKAAALKYKKLFEANGHASVAVIMSPPDSREGHTEDTSDNTREVQQFWQNMMDLYGSQEHYEESIIAAFDSDNEPDILIVVDKLLTGFDVPRNTVLYVDKRLKEHNILQAIARVNRLYDEDKEYGYIVDYRGIFGDLNEAIELYDALEREGFDSSDVEGTLTNIRELIAKLPTHHSAVWDVFNGVGNKTDNEAMQQWLEPQDRRDAFYAALKAYARTLQMALANPRFQDETDLRTLKRYTDDLKVMLNLRAAVKQRYGEAVDYSRYEQQIRQMVQEQIGAYEVQSLIEPVNLFDVESFAHELDSIEGDAAKADTIASRVKKVITERMDEDPVLYQQLSELIQAAIDAHRAKRLSDAEYLAKVRQHMETLRSKGQNSVPASIAERHSARVYFRIISEKIPSAATLEPEALATLAVNFDNAIQNHKIRDWQHNEDVKNAMFTALDDALFDFTATHHLELNDEARDTLLNKILNTAQYHD